MKMTHQLRLQRVMLVSLADTSLRNINYESNTVGRDVGIITSIADDDTPRD